MLPRQAGAPSTLLPAPPCLAKCVFCTAFSDPRERLIHPSIHPSLEQMLIAHLRGPDTVLGASNVSMHKAKQKVLTSRNHDF